MSGPVISSRADGEQKVSDKIEINRNVFLHHELRSTFNYEKDKVGFKEKFREYTSSCDPVESLKTLVPIIDWLPKYSWKNDFSADIVAGITVAIMHISQGMAYGMLAQVAPVCGIYTAFFPVLVYFIFGMARHNSMGTFAVTSLMVGVVVSDQTNPDDPNEKKLIVASAVCFLSGIYQLLMYILRLGIVSTLLSETLVSGFTTGAAVHVLFSQIKDIFGLTLPKDKAQFTNVYTLYNIFDNITDFNYMTFIVAITTMIISILNNEILKPILAKKTAIPFPMELILTIAGTAVSYGFSLHEDFGVKIVGALPAGLPSPVLPSFDIMGQVWSQALMIAIVSYTVSLSMGLIFAQKYNYDVDANQELFAQGLGNIVGSFYSCITFAASLSRSSIQANSGCKSMFTSAISSAILLIILLWIGPYFEHLPKASLAGIIVVALKGLLFQVKQFPVFWNLNKLDGVVWMLTFLTVSLVSIDIGLLVGIVSGLLVILIRGIKPYYCLLGTVPNTGLYLDVKRYKGAEQFDEFKIFHYQGSINFASKTLFRSCLFESIALDPTVEFAYRKKLEKVSGDYGSTANLMKRWGKPQYRQSEIKCLIWDFSALTYIDPSGISMLKTLSLEFKKIDVPIFVAGCSEPVYGAMLKCDLLDTKKEYFTVFVSIHDAVLYANRWIHERNQQSNEAMSAPPLKLEVNKF